VPDKKKLEDAAVDLFVPDEERISKVASKHDVPPSILKGFCQEKSPEVLVAIQASGKRAILHAELDRRQKNLDAALKGEGQGLRDVHKEFIFKLNKEALEELRTQDRAAFLVIHEFFGFGGTYVPTPTSYAPIGVRGFWKGIARLWKVSDNTVADWVEAALEEFRKCAQRIAREKYNLSV